MQIISPICWNAFTWFSMTIHKIYLNFDTLFKKKVCFLFLANPKGCKSSGPLASTNGGPP